MFALNPQDISRKYFKSCDYAITIIRKAASYDLATDADEQSQEYIISALSAYYPDITTTS